MVPGKKAFYYLVIPITLVLPGKKSNNSVQLARLVGGIFVRPSVRPSGTYALTKVGGLERRAARFAGKEGGDGGVLTKAEREARVHNKAERAARFHFTI